MFCCMESKAAAPIEDYHSRLSGNNCCLAKFGSIMANAIA